MYKCFESFSMSERLEKGNEWYCPKCKSHVLATIKIEIYQVPKILVIHLKRFRTRGHYREKLATPINFPIEGLNLSDYVLSNQQTGLYDLYAISNHYGSLGGGHYTACCYNEFEKTWVELNDSNVSRASDLVTNSAYVLFYRMRGV